MRTKVLGLALAIVASAAIVSASGAATTKAQVVKKIDVSTRAAVIHYLHSIHVKANGAVIQRGRHNYAGTRCPGVVWTCANTRHTIVQITQPGGQNRFKCKSASCVVVQITAVSSGVYLTGPNRASTVAATKGGGGGNAATCINPTTGVCTINQSGVGPNTAVVYESPGKKSGLSQNVSFSASITQQATGATAGNTACVTQVMGLDATATAGSGSLAVNLNGHQSVTIKQDVAGSGANSAQYAATSSGTCDTSHALTQTQTLTSQADAPKGVTQNENATQTACPDGNLTPDYANLCLDIEQNQGTGHGVASGTNNATFTQTNTLSAIADSKSGPISQTQSTVNGGLLGTINQDSSGVSVASATQTEKQCEDAAKGGLGSTCHTNDADAAEAPASLTQVQHGPVKKGLGTATQTGNDADTYTITQNSQQDTDQGPGSTQTNTVQADCTTQGTCTATQSTSVDGQTNTNTQSGQTVDTSTNCTGSTCTPTLPAPTLTSTPPDPSYSSSASFSFTDTNTSATFLCDIGSGFSACSSPKTYTGLTNGSHTFSVEATNNGATSAPTQYTWLIAPPPTPTITSDPGTTSNSPSASFSFDDADSTATFECQVDNSGYSSCSSPWTYNNLADGSHTFAVKAEDQTGESSPATFTWTISGGGASADTVDTLNPPNDPVNGQCTDSYSSGGFDLPPQKVTDTIDLSAYDGQAIQLRFSFNTGDALYNAFAGWYLNNIQVTQSNSTVFSDAVAAGDTNFTAISDFGVAPGWHVTNNNATMGTAWWYGNDATGTYQTPGSADTCADTSPNSGTITTPVFSLGATGSSQLSFDTLWQIEGVNSSGFDLMQVQVIPVTSGPPIQ